MPRSPQTLTVEERQLVASWAADCAAQVLSIYETAVPADARVRDAIDQARRFASGDLDVAEAIRRRGGDAAAAARDAPTPAATAAAYAAEQAAAVAHMGPIHSAQPDTQGRQRPEPPLATMTRSHSRKRTDRSQR